MPPDVMNESFMTSDALNESFMTSGTLDGGAPGVACRSTHEPSTGLTATLISDNHRGGGALLGLLDEFLTKA